MSDVQYCFPRSDLGETEQFRITSGTVGQENAQSLFCAGRHSFIEMVDADPGQDQQPIFMCRSCTSFGIADKEVHACERSLGK